MAKNKAIDSWRNKFLLYIHITILMVLHVANLGFIYHIRGKFRWAKLSWYSYYMDFPGNTFAVQGYVRSYIASYK